MERERPERRMIYNRSGNLAIATHLDEEKADGFMRRADMRNDIVIIDSDKKPEGSTVGVGQDTLAWRMIPTIEELTKIHFRPQRLHTLVRQGRRFQIQVHEREIDEKIRSGHFVGRDDYQEQFLKILNKAVRQGTAQALTQEKFGWKNNEFSYLYYAIWTGLDLFYAPFALTDLALYFIILHPTVNVFGRISPSPPSPEHNPGMRKSWKEIWLPLIAVDRWALGQLYLVRQGNKLVIPK